MPALLRKRTRLRHIRQLQGRDMKDKTNIVRASAVSFQRLTAHRKEHEYAFFNCRELSDYVRHLHSSRHQSPRTEISALYGQRSRLSIERDDRSPVRREVFSILVINRKEA